MVRNWQKRHINGTERNPRVWLTPTQPTGPTRRSKGDSTGERSPFRQNPCLRLPLLPRLRPRGIWWVFVIIILKIQETIEQSFTLPFFTKLLTSVWRSFLVERTIHYCYFINCQNNRNLAGPECISVNLCIRGWKEKWAPQISAVLRHFRGLFPPLPIFQAREGDF